MNISECQIWHSVVDKMSDSDYSDSESEERACPNCKQEDTCWYCKEEGCSLCIKTVCCDCCVEICNVCRKDDSILCGCYGYCTGCSAKVDRGANGWPCYSCSAWLCDNCYDNTALRCKECTIDSDSE